MGQGNLISNNRTGIRILSEPTQLRLKFGETKLQEFLLKIMGFMVVLSIGLVRIM